MLSFGKVSACNFFPHSFCIPKQNKVLQAHKEESNTNYSHLVRSLSLNYLADMVNRDRNSSGTGNCTEPQLLLCKLSKSAAKPCAFLVPSRPLSPFSHLVTSGNHCTVRLGHSSACVITRSYKKGVFFFQILYSSLITRSSTVSSSAAGGKEK